jgi:hypothetical protein
MDEKDLRIKLLQESLAFLNYQLIQSYSTIDKLVSMVCTMPVDPDAEIEEIAPHPG